MPPATSKVSKRSTGSTVPVTPSKKGLIAKVLQKHLPASNSYTAKDFKKIIEADYPTDPGATVVNCSSGAFNAHIKSIRDLCKRARLHGSRAERR